MWVKVYGLGGVISKPSGVREAEVCAVTGVEQFRWGSRCAHALSREPIVRREGAPCGVATSALSEKYLEGAR